MTCIIWCATSRTTNSGRKPSNKCCSNRSTSNAICGRLSSRCGSTTSKAATTIWQSAPLSRPCSTPLTTSMPGMPKTVRRTTRSGTIANFKRSHLGSIGKSTPKQRLHLIRQAEAVMEQDPPLVPVAWEKINDVWYNYVKGHNPSEYFGIYDVVRLDTVWLDKP